MSTIRYDWHSETPPKPDVYVTRRGYSRYTTNRYWDGERWHEVAIGGNRGGTPFKWPKGSSAKEPRPQSWERAPWINEKRRYTFILRKIHKDAHLIQWGTPYTEYDDSEVLRYLVEAGNLPKNWRTHYQADMRAAQFK